MIKDQLGAYCLLSLKRIVHRFDAENYCQTTKQYMENKKGDTKHILYLSNFTFSIGNAMRSSENQNLSKSIIESDTEIDFP